MTLERTYRPQDIAEHLGVGVYKVMGWIRRGELKAYNISNSAIKPRWRIKLSDVEAFMEGRSNRINLVPKQKRRRRPPGKGYV